jgi:hypothetical protein
MVNPGELSLDATAPILHDTKSAELTEKSVVVAVGSILSHGTLGSCASAGDVVRSVAELIMFD